MKNNKGFANIFVVILVVVIVVVGGYFVFKNLSTPPTSQSPTQTPEALAPVPATNPQVASVPTSTRKPTPTPIPVPPLTPKSQKIQPALNVFVIQNDGILTLPTGQIEGRAVAKKFYELNPDKKTTYDFLSIFSTFRNPVTIESHDSIRYDATGIGLLRTPSPDDLPIKLLGINLLNDTYKTIYLQSKDIKNNLWLLVHETGHQWLQYLENVKGVSDGSHYSKWADTGFIKNGQQWSDAMGGWPWKDNKDGTVSASNIQKQAFSPLSLYLMGFAPASEVPNMRIVIPASSDDKNFQNVKGTFTTISVNDIIAQYGARTPSYQNSQKNFKMAYILLTKKGETLEQYGADLNNVNTVAKDFPAEWNLVTNGRSTINR